MKAEDEMKIVAALDRIITKLDDAVDELLEIDTPASQKVESMLMNVSVDLTVLLDRITEYVGEGQQKVGSDA